VRPGVAGDLSRDPQELEILAAHLEKDLALGVELERLFQSFFNLVFVFVIYRSGICWSMNLSRPPGPPSRRLTARATASAGALF
jgi:hypothetical protein